MVKYKIRVKGEGSSHRRAYTGQDGKKVRSLMIGAVEEHVLDLTGKMMASTGLAASERVLWLSAVYFQRIISRTPRDENYSYRSYDKSKKKWYIHYHKDDKDYIQDYWTARYGRYQPITAAYLRESCGCTFERFNDPKEIQIIYKIFRDTFFGKEGSRGRANKESGKTILRGVRIRCEYPDDKQHKLRYHLLEYGGYVGDGVIKHGPDLPHGVAGNRSIQAPSGMTALTDAEFEQEQFNVPNSEILANLKKLSKVVVDPKKLRKLLGSKRRLSTADMALVMKEYGV